MKLRNSFFMGVALLMIVSAGGALVSVLAEEKPTEKPEKRKSRRKSARPRTTRPTPPSRPPCYATRARAA
jgi:hypothetical protein